MFEYIDKDYFDKYCQNLQLAVKNGSYSQFMQNHKMPKVIFKEPISTDSYIGRILLNWIYPK